MGRSQIVVFGYGAILTAQQFLEAFPNTLVYYQEDNQYDTNPNVWRSFARESDLIKYVTSSEDDELYSGVTHIFITTKSAIDYDFEKGYIDELFVNVNLDQIITEKALVEPWLRENFPDVPIGYFLFGYIT